MATGCAPSGAILVCQRTNTIVNGQTRTAVRRQAVGSIARNRGVNEALQPILKQPEALGFEGYVEMLDVARHTLALDGH